MDEETEIERLERERREQRRREIAEESRRLIWRSRVSVDRLMTENEAWRLIEKGFGA